MDTYSVLRQFADSWGLLFLFLVFVSVVIWAFLPSKHKDRVDASMIPFRNDYDDLDPGLMDRAAPQNAGRIGGQNR